MKLGQCRRHVSDEWANRRFRQPVRFGKTGEQRASGVVFGNREELPVPVAVHTERGGEPIARTRGAAGQRVEKRVVREAASGRQLEDVLVARANRLHAQQGVRRARIPQAFDQPILCRQTVRNRPCIGHRDASGFNAREPAGRHRTHTPRREDEIGRITSSGGHSRRWQRCQDELNDLRACTFPRPSKPAVVC